MLSRLLSIFTRNAPERMPPVAVVNDEAGRPVQGYDSAPISLYASVEVELKAAGFLT